MQESNDFSQTSAELSASPIYTLDLYTYLALNSDVLAVKKQAERNKSENRSKCRKRDAN
jgi:hypothetical protein